MAPRPTFYTGRVSSSRIFDVVFYTEFMATFLEVGYLREVVFLAEIDLRVCEMLALEFVFLFSAITLNCGYFVIFRSYDEFNFSLRLCSPSSSGIYCTFFKLPKLNFLGRLTTCFAFSRLCCSWLISRWFTSIYCSLTNLMF